MYLVTLTIRTVTGFFIYTFVNTSCIFVAFIYQFSFGACSKVFACFLKLHNAHGHVSRLQWCLLMMSVSCLILHVWRVFSMEHLGIHCSSSAPASPFVHGEAQKPLGPQPDLTNDKRFTSRTAEGASRSESHFETHSSKHFGPVLVGYSEGESGAVKEEAKNWGSWQEKMD